MQRNRGLNLATVRNETTEADLEGLLLAIARGSQKDFKMLVDATSPKIFGILLTMLRDRDLARDALQVSFARIWLRAKSFDPQRGTAGAWISQIARNHAIDLLRQRKRRAEVQPEDFQDIVDTAPSVEQRLMLRGDMRKMLDCLDKIDPKKAQAVRLSYIHGLSYLELAERMSTPLNTIRTWLRRGLAALRDCVDG
jgi:RNA polymerase sigma-70 factor, ECF subfamily